MFEVTVQIFAYFCALVSSNCLLGTQSTVQRCPAEHYRWSSHTHGVYSETYWYSSDKYLFIPISYVYLTFTFWVTIVSHDSDEQDAQLSQRNRAAGCVIVFAKSRRLELGDNILRTLLVYLQPLWYNRPENLSNSVKKRKIRAITSFKIIQGHRGRYQSKARMLFPISD